MVLCHHTSERIDPTKFKYIIFLFIRNIISAELFIQEIELNHRRSDANRTW